MQTSGELTRLGLPPADQIGFVVGDLDAWMARFDPLFGPFETMDGSVQAALYRGRIADVGLRIAYGRTGDLEIEFIQWTSGESPHREAIEAGREGMHHIRFRVDCVDEWIPKLEAIGYRPAWYKRWNASTTFAYLEREGDTTWVELLQMPADGAGAPE